MVILKKNIAFSLIELMIGITVIAILATIAVSNYRDYIIRSKVSEVINLAQADLKKITQWIDLNGLPTSVNDAALIDTYVGHYAAAGSSYVSDTRFSDFWGYYVRINVGSLSNIDIRLRYLPVSDGISIKWYCGYGSATAPNNKKYLPANCQQLIHLMGLPRLW